MIDWEKIKEYIVFRAQNECDDDKFGKLSDEERQFIWDFWDDYSIIFEENGSTKNKKNMSLEDYEKYIDRKIKLQILK